MVNSTATTPSQSHGGALYYVVEVPREEYLKECAAQATAMASAGGYPNPTYQAQYAAHHQQFQNVPNTTILARLNSTESGWDNPFRPGGDLSREADEIVNLIKYGGKPITPTGDQSLVNGSTPKDSHSTDDPDTTVVDGAVAKHEASQLQAAAAQQNGTKSPHKSPGTAAGGAAGSPALGAKNGTTGADGSTVHSSTTPISNQVIPGPQSASHVVIDEKKKKKCTCCVIQ
ncbi:AGAP000086-PB [Anopheles gambiae str. PEST]|uniref:AGAP000086-PB n=1 Tax=Anopheles gambiae TaxID=7165 RepID=F5HJS5_ANOGA|nr:AGAP000086-PB [Anopheles gambiae str. PEST]